MKIRTRLCVSLDGFVTTPEGWPAQLADPSFSPESYGFYAIQETCDAVLMGRSTFEPAIGADPWPWGDLDVFVLGSRRPADTPEHVVVDPDPEGLLAQIRETNEGGDVHLVGGPSTIEAFRAIAALDKLGLIVLPFLLGDGMRLTPPLSTDIALKLESEEAFGDGLVELTYDVS